MCEVGALMFRGGFLVIRSVSCKLLMKWLHGMRSKVILVLCCVCCDVEPHTPPWRPSGEQARIPCHLITNWHHR